MILIIFYNNNNNNNNNNNFNRFFISTIFNFFLPEDTYFLNIDDCGLF